MFSVNGMVDNVASQIHLRENLISVVSCPSLKPPSVKLVVCNTGMVGNLPNKICSVFQPIKNDIALKTMNIHRTPCKHGTTYTVQNGGSGETWVMEHHCHI
jgi:hypothetical protein